MNEDELKKAFTGKVVPTKNMTATKDSLENQLKKKEIVVHRLDELIEKIESE